MEWKKKLPIGIEFFKDFKRDVFYYVDKTGFIRDLVNSRGSVNLITRPRRFGKSLNMDMLKNFFTALWDGNAQQLTKLISYLLFDTISYHDYAESFYPQIRNRQYAEKAERDGYKKVGRLGIAFFQKKCLVKKG